jgi:hypothetical protein
MNQMSRGILTMAYGEQRYIEMAKTLARSLRLHSDKIPRAIVTDSSDPELRELYHLCIPLKAEFGQVFKQKLYIDRYSPFEETLFIDSDCIVVANIEFLWKFFSKISFGVVGYQKHEGKAFADILDIEKIISLLNLSSVPVFNGGIYYYKNNSEVAQVFSEARRIEKNYESLGIEKFRASVADEPVFAIALALTNIEAVTDEQGLTMRTPLNMTGSIHIDVLQGYCHFIKEGKLVQPAIAHFCGGFAEGFYYNRERLKLNLLQRMPHLNYQLISWVANVSLPLFYPPAVYRGLKSYVKEFFI